MVITLRGKKEEKKKHGQVKLGNSTVRSRKHLKSKKIHFCSEI